MKKEKAAPKKLWAARFDEEGGLVGFDAITADDERANGVVFDHLPDNACDGRYRWDDNLRRFEPRPHVVAALGDSAVNNQMVVQGLLGIVDRTTLPLAIQDRIRFVELTSPGTKKALEKKYNALLGVEAVRRRRAG